VTKKALGIVGTWIGGVGVGGTKEMHFDVIHSFSSLSYDRSKASSPHSAI